MDLDKQKFASNVVPTGDFVAARHVEFPLYMNKISWSEIGRVTVMFLRSSKRRLTSLGKILGK